MQSVSDTSTPFDTLRYGSSMTTATPVTAWLVLCSGTVSVSLRVGQVPSVDQTSNFPFRFRRRQLGLRQQQSAIAATDRLESAVVDTAASVLICRFGQYTALQQAQF